jgi:hypothetical protein
MTEFVEPWCIGMFRTYFCQAQFQLAIAVAIELSLALLSLLNSPPPARPVKVSKQLISTQLLIAKASLA